MIKTEAVAATSVENASKLRWQVDVTSVLISILTLLAGGSVIEAFLLDWAGWPVTIGNVGLVELVATVGLVGWWGWRNRSLFRNSPFKLRATNWAGALGFLVVSSGVLAYGLWLGRPYQLPVDVSVDAVHQYGLADYILQKTHFPIHDPTSRANLLEGLEYPPGLVSLVALLAGLLKADPVYVIYPTIAGLVALTAGVVWACLDLLLAGRRWRWPVTALATGFLLLPYDYTFGIFTFQSYYAQVGGQLFLLLSLYFGLLWRRQTQQNEKAPGTPYLILVGLIASLGALLLTYPTFVLIPLAGFGLTVLTSPFSLAGWQLRLINLALLYGLVGGLAILFFAPRVKTGLAILANEGSVLSPDLSLYGWPVLGLALLGLGVALVSGRVRQMGGLVVVWFALAFVIEGVGLWLMKVDFNQGSFYAIDKLFYTAVYFLPLLAGLGINWLLDKTNQYLASKQRSIPKLPEVAKIASGLALFGLFLANIWLNHPEIGRPFEVLTPAKIEVTQWMVSHLQLKPGQVAYSVQSGLTAYWLEVGLLKQPRNDHSDQLLHQTQPLSFETWFQTPDSPTYFLTEASQNLSLDERSKIFYQSGPVVLLTRTPAYYQQQQTQPSIAIDYEASLQKGQLSLRTEVSVSDEPSHWLQVGLRIVSPDKKQVFFQATAPVAVARVERRQYLGVSLKLPQLTVTELYANTLYPPVPTGQTALVPGSYLAEMVLQKDGQPVEYQPLMKFDYRAPDQFVSNQPTGSIKGRLSYEGRAVPDVAPLTTPFDYSVNGEQLQLVGLSSGLPVGQALTVNASGTFQLKTQWQIARPVVKNYSLRWTWLNENGEREFETEVIPSSGHYPTWLWPTNQPVSFVETLTTPERPGTYTLQLTLVDSTTNLRSQAFTLYKQIVVQ